MHSTRGVLLFVLGVFLFACMDTTVKVLAATWAVPVIAAVRYAVHCLLMMMLLGPKHGRELLRTQRTGLVLVRAACLVGSTLLFSLALQRMPLAEATAFLFVAPLLVTVIAGFALREAIGVLGWVAVLAGFGGIMLIARPGGGLDPMGVLLACCAACTATGYALLSRILASTEKTLPMLFITALLGTVVFGLLAPFFWGGPEPTLAQAGLFVLIGTFGAIGHFLFTAAHRDAPASTLAPISYAQLAFAVLLGWLVFGAVPHGISFIGMAVIAAAGMLVALKSRLVARAAADPAE